MVDKVLSYRSLPTLEMDPVSLPTFFARSYWMKDAGVYEIALTLDPSVAVEKALSYELAFLHSANSADSIISPIDDAPSLAIPGVDFAVDTPSPLSVSSSTTIKVRRLPYTKYHKTKYMRVAVRPTGGPLGAWTVFTVFFTSQASAPIMSFLLPIPATLAVGGTYAGYLRFDTLSEEPRIITYENDTAKTGTAVLGTDYSITINGSPIGSGVGEKTTVSIPGNLYRAPIVLTGLANSSGSSKTIMLAFDMPVSQQTNYCNFSSFLKVDTTIGKLAESEFMLNNWPTNWAMGADNTGLNIPGQSLEYGSQDTILAPLLGDNPLNTTKETVRALKTQSTAGTFGAIIKGFSQSLIGAPWDKNITGNLAAMGSWNQLSLYMKKYTSGTSSITLIDRTIQGYFSNTIAPTTLEVTWDGSGVPTVAVGRQGITGTGSLAHVSTVIPSAWYRITLLYQTPTLAQVTSAAVASGEYSQTQLDNYASALTNEGNVVNYLLRPVSSAGTDLVSDGRGTYMWGSFFGYPAGGTESDLLDYQEHLGMAWEAERNVVPLSPNPVTGVITLQVP